MRYRKVSLHSGFKEYFIVLLCLILSKSLYYETYGDNLLLGFFLVFLILNFNPVKIKINKNVVLYFLFFIALIGVNTEVKYSSVIVLFLRMLIGIYVMHALSFSMFSTVYTRIILILSMLSLLSFLVVYLNIPSPLPDFVGIDSRHLRNFVFFGVSESMIEHQVYRNSGLWWEPGAFQLFINLAFIFGIINRAISKKEYAIFALTIISTVSTTGVLVFILLSSIYWWRHISISENRFVYLVVTTFLSLVVGLIGVPFLLIKFGVGNDSGGESVSFLSRYYDFIISYNMLKDNIIIGYGFGSQIENAIPYGVNYLGFLQYEFINPTGSDGLTMFVAQCGIFSLILLYPFLFPRYSLGQGIFPRLIICISMILLFNTENFTFILIFSLLSLYGLVGCRDGILRDKERFWGV